MPITPFIGVRISWLMVARNSDLASVAASASTRRALSSSLRRTSAVTSQLTPTILEVAVGPAVDGADQGADVPDHPRREGSGGSRRRSGR